MAKTLLTVEPTDEIREWIEDVDAWFISHATLEFENEEDALMFVLKFGDQVRRTYTQTR